MRMTTFGVIPVACALAGAIAAPLLTMRTLEVYAASATILLADRVAANAPAPGEELRVSLARALEASEGSPAETSVTLLRERAGQATIRLTYLDRDPARAQRVAQSLADAIVANDAARTPSPRVVEAPHLPTAPVAPAYAAAGASGGAVGLAAGALCA